MREKFDAAAQSGSDERMETLELIEGAIIRAVAEILLIDVSSVNPFKNLAEPGFHNLTAAELRKWFHRALGIYLQMQNLPNAQVSIRTLAATVVDKVKLT